MSINKKNNNELIEKAYITDPYNAENYSELSILPITNLIDCQYFSDEVSLLNFQLIDNKSKYNDKIVRYIKFKVKTDEPSRINLIVHNNFRKMKIWRNNIFLAYINSWYEKILIDLEPGDVMILLK